MKANNYVEATAILDALEKEAKTGARSLLGGVVKLDSVKAWNGTSEHALDGTELRAFYLSYMVATPEQIKAGAPADSAGVNKEEVAGRLIDMRVCQDGTVQVLVTNGFRFDPGQPITFRSFNIHKGMVIALAFNEGLGVTLNQALSLAPEDEILKLKAAKGKADRRLLKNYKATGTDPVKEYATELAKLMPSRGKGKKKV